MTRKWSNENLPGALHYVTGNFVNRLRVFTHTACCQAFLAELQGINQRWPAKLIAYVLMPDHFHLISNPRDGRIKEFIGELKSLSAKAIIISNPLFKFPDDGDQGHQVWQESFKAMPLWSGWMIWQKINYIHANPVKAGLVKSAKDYRWSSFSSFYSGDDGPITVDRQWAWPDDAEKLSQAVRHIRERKGKLPDFLAAFDRSGGKPPS
jgi:REP-associated tyrosine transposase